MTTKIRANSKTVFTLVKNPIVDNCGAILLIVVLLLILKSAYNRYMKTKMLKVKEYFTTPENYFIMDENKEYYYNFTDASSSDVNVHRSTELSYTIGGTNFTTIPYTLNIDFTSTPITENGLPSVRHFSNSSEAVTLEKVIDSGSGVSDALFYIHKQMPSKENKYIGKNYDKGTGSFEKAFTVTADSKEEKAKKFRLVRQEDAQTAIRRFNPFIGKPTLTIHPKNSQIDVSFEINPSQAARVDNFLIVLAKYDKDKNHIGHIKVHTSEETNEGKDICNVEMGRRKCKHTLTDIDHIDNNGAVLYYRVSVIAISNGNVISNYMEPIYPGGYTHFVMTKTFKDMEDMVERARNESMTEAQRDSINSQLVSEAGGEYEFIKKQLGGYPDNLILDINKNTLSDVVAQSMSLGEINMVVT